MNEKAKKVISYIASGLLGSLLTLGLVAGVGACTMNQEKKQEEQPSPSLTKTIKREKTTDTETGYNQYYFTITNTLEANQDTTTYYLMDSNYTPTLVSNTSAQGLYFVVHNTSNDTQGLAEFRFLRNTPGQNINYLSFVFVNQNFEWYIDESGYTSNGVILTTFGATYKVFSSTLPKTWHWDFQDVESYYKTLGYDHGHEEGYNTGHQIGYEEGQADGYSEGYHQGTEAGYQEGYNQGLTDQAKPANYFEVPKDYYPTKVIKGTLLENGLFKTNTAYTRQVEIVDIDIGKGKIGPIAFRFGTLRFYFNRAFGSNIYTATGEYLYGEASHQPNTQADIYKSCLIPFYIELKYFKEGDTTNAITQTLLTSNWTTYEGNTFQATTMQWVDDAFRQITIEEQENQTQLTVRVNNATETPLTQTYDELLRSYTSVAEGVALTWTGNSKTQYGGSLITDTAYVSVFSILENAFIPVITFFSIQVFPGLTLGTLILTPVFVGLIIAIIKLLSK